MFPSEALQKEATLSEQRTTLFCLLVPSFLILKQPAIKLHQSLPTLLPETSQQPGSLIHQRGSKYSLLCSTEESHPRPIVAVQDKRISRAWNQASRTTRWLLSSTVWESRSDLTRVPGATAAPTGPDLSRPFDDRF